MRAFAHAVGVAVENKPAFEKWADDVDEHVMHDAVAKRCFADQAFFRLINVEAFIAPC